MSLRGLSLLFVAALLLAGGAAGASAGEDARLERVLDGDTVEVRTGARVRLLQVDAPELGSGECYSRKAAAVLRALAPPGTPVRLERDPRLDSLDPYGRQLRYLHRGRVNVNVELVRRGAATVWFYDGARGRYAGRLLAAAREARRARRGLWGACRTVWNPYGPATTAPRGATPDAYRCDPSYPAVCIAPPPPDLDCDDVPYRRFRVVGADPHRFDGDADGIGCERDA